MKTNKNINSMYALLLAAAVLLGGSIWFACSADDEFESNYEMETLAKGEMSLSPEPSISNTLTTNEISAHVIFTYIPFINQIIDPDTADVSFKIQCDSYYNNFRVTNFKCINTTDGEVGALVFHKQNIGSNAFNITVVFPISKTVVSPYTNQDTVITSSPSKQYIINKSDLQ